MPATCCRTVTSFPYLCDKFFYTSASPAFNGSPANWDPVYGPSSGGWFKMFEFFEVPSAVFGAIGQVSQGSNYDWLRQDTKPGLLNLNLIIDEEVFLGLMGNAGNITPQPATVQIPAGTGPDYPLQQVAVPPPSLNNTQVIPTFTPQVVTQCNAAGAPTAFYPMPSVGFFDSTPDGQRPTS